MVGLADPTQLELAVINLAINARDAMSSAESSLSERRMSPLNSHSPGRATGRRIRGDFVADTGGGMPETVRSKVFEPFFTTKDVGKGSGLGLSQVLGFAKQSDGGVRIETEEEKGPRFSFTFPARVRHARQTPRLPTSSRPTVPPAGRSCSSMTTTLCARWRGRCCTISAIACSRRERRRGNRAVEAAAGYRSRHCRLCHAGDEWCGRGAADKENRPDPAGAVHHGLRRPDQGGRDRRTRHHRQAIQLDEAGTANPIRNERWLVCADRLSAWQAPSQLRRPRSGKRIPLSASCCPCSTRVMPTAQWTS